MTKVIRWRGFQEFWFLCPEQEVTDEEREIITDFELVEVPQELLDNYHFAIVVIRDVFNQLEELTEKENQ